MPGPQMLPDNTIWHLNHSSFLLKRAGIVMIFDYFEPRSHRQTAPEQALGKGLIRPEVLKEETVYVLASHGHQDHFHPDIYTFRDHVPDIFYLLSYDIPAPPEDAVVFRPGERKTVGDIQVQAYPSTDDGLAYSIYLNDEHIYFSGDNAFWNWDGDLDDAIYQRLALSAIDHQTPMAIAFQVCDPRLDGMGDGGIHIFAREFNPALLVPIHSFGRYAFNASVEKRLRADGFTNAFWCLAERGEQYTLR